MERDHSWRLTTALSPENSFNITAKNYLNVVDASIWPWNDFRLPQESEGNLVLSREPHLVGANGGFPAVRS
jgi:hypothetical protein